MSAECNRCGCDLTYPAGSWPVGRCEPCDLRASVQTLTSAIDRVVTAYGKRRGFSSGSVVELRFEDDDFDELLDALAAADLASQEVRA